MTPTPRDRQVAEFLRHFDAGPLPVAAHVRLDAAETALVNALLTYALEHLEAVADDERAVARKVGAAVLGGTGLVLPGLRGGVWVVYSEAAPPYGNQVVGVYDNEDQASRHAAANASLYKVARLELNPAVPAVAR